MRDNVNYFSTIKKMGKDETKFKQRTLDPVVVDVDLASSLWYVFENSVQKHMEVINCGLHAPVHLRLKKLRLSLRPALKLFSFYHIQLTHKQEIIKPLQYQVNSNSY